MIPAKKICIVIMAYFTR